mmetsp:Transcript_20023/g.42750  ORF Transcript_20023/g.42750 Transcript_20023/m.42750 type:complete len:228 (+) Transcript_20023:73-756(+)
MPGFLNFEAAIAEELGDASASKSGLDFDSAIAQELCLDLDAAIAEELGSTPPRKVTATSAGDAEANAGSLSLDDAIEEALRLDFGVAMAEELGTTPPEKMARPLIEDGSPLNFEGAIARALHLDLEACISDELRLDLGVAIAQELGGVVTSPVKRSMGSPETASTISGTPSTTSKSPSKFERFAAARAAAAAVAEDPAAEHKDEAPFAVASLFAVASAESAEEEPSA